jgi:hypothetical protein
MKFYVLPIAIAAVVALRIIMHFVDKERIKDEVGARGGWVISIRWNPFARGWFFEKNERHYEVTYRNRAGAVVTTTCKTSFFSGVYWAEPQKLTGAADSDYRAPSLLQVRLRNQRRMAQLS